MTGSRDLEFVTLQIFAVKSLPHETQKHSKEWKIFPSTKSYKSPSHSQGVILEQQTMLNEYRRTDISCTHS